MKKTLLILFTLVLTLALAMPAMAILHLQYAEGQRLDMDAYVVMPFYWQDTAYSDDQKAADPALNKNDGDLGLDMYGHSRYTISLTSGNISGTWQVGFGDADSGDAPTPNTRLIYGTWNISEDASFSMGKMYAPYYYWGSNRLNGDPGFSGGYGSNYDDFDPQFLFTFKGFYLNLKEPAKPVSAEQGAVIGNPGDVDIDTKIPRVFVGYTGNHGPVYLVTGIGFNTFHVNAPSISFDEDINSWAASAYVDVKITDAAKIVTGGFFGDNLGDMHYGGLQGKDAAGSVNSAGVVVVDTGNGYRVEDTRGVSGFIEGWYNFGPATFKAGYGYGEADNDTFTHKDTQQSYYAQVEVPIYKDEATGANLTLWPEVAVFDKGKATDGTDEETDTFIGLVTQINF